MKKSTIVRSLRMLYRTTELVAPPVGVRLLDRAWFGLPVVPAKAKRLTVELPPSTPFEIPFENTAIRGYIYGDQPTFGGAAVRATAGQRTVYLVHGWGGWGLQLAAFVPGLVADGFRVVVYDAPSHGESAPGREGAGRSTLLEIADAFQAVVAALGPAYGVLAHSIGAAAISQALKNGTRVERVVFVAAATDFAVTLDLFQAALGFGPRVRAGFVRRFTRRFGPMEGFEVSRVIDELAEDRELPPLLAIHDRDDRETEYEGSVRLAATWPNASFELTQGLGHNRILRDAAVAESVRGFLSADREGGDRPREAQGTMQG